MTNEEILKEKLEHKMQQARYYKNKTKELEATIKEVREWIRIVQTNEDRKHFEPIINTDELDYILEILDKENTNE